MHLVVNCADRAVVIDDVDGIVDSGLRRIVSIGEPHGAGDQHGALRQEIRDLGERIGFARQEKRERRLRPDQMRYIANALRLRPRCAAGKSDVTVHHLLLGRVIETHVLLQVGLHDA